MVALQGITKATLVRQHSWTTMSVSTNIDTFIQPNGVWVNINPVDSFIDPKDAFKNVCQVFLI